MNGVPRGLLKSTVDAEYLLFIVDDTGRFIVTRDMSSTGYNGFFAVLGDAHKGETEK